MNIFCQAFLSCMYLSVKKSLHRKMQNYKSTMQLTFLERNIVIQIKHYAQYIKVKILTAHQYLRPLSIIIESQFCKHYYKLSSLRLFTVLYFSMRSSRSSTSYCSWRPPFYVIINNYWMRFCDIRNNQGLGKCSQPKPSASAENTYLDLDYSGYHKNRI